MMAPSRTPSLSKVALNKGASSRRHFLAYCSPCCCDMPSANPKRESTCIPAQTETALQELINCFAHACSQISIKKNNILGQDISAAPYISIGDCTLDVLEDFTYLGSNISSNLSLDTELNMRIGKASAAMARLIKRVRENTMLTIKTKTQVYQACVLSTLLYGSESWTLYTQQERRLNTFHMCCLRRILGISWQDHIPNTEVLARTGSLSMYALLTKRRLRWLGHVTRMHDGRLPKDILYGELATGSRPTGRPTLRYKDVLKRDLKAGCICQQALKHWQRTAAVGNTLPSQPSRQQSRRERSSGKRRELGGAREQRQRQPPRTTTSSHAATATGSAVRGSASTATAGAAALPPTDIYRHKPHCLLRQTDANIRLISNWTSCRTIQGVITTISKFSNLIGHQQA